jgi:hypothetical protein
MDDTLSHGGIMNKSLLEFELRNSQFQAGKKGRVKEDRRT